MVEVEGSIAGEDGVESSEVQVVDQDRVLRGYLLNVMIVDGRAQRWRGEGNEKREVVQKAAHVEMRMMSNLEGGITVKRVRVESE